MTERVVARGTMTIAGQDSPCELYVIVHADGTRGFGWRRV